ncbi:MAG: RNA polymerase factor sigma-54 [Planctomycetia bacterium]|nr:RNA polymerase factor sigma-54 [Planctomycetia bacterium]
MSMGFRIHQQQRQVQKQVQTLRMIQSMEILQLSTLELQERIQEELQENPALEVREDLIDGQEDGQDETESFERTTIEERVLDIGHGNESSDFERLSSMDGEIPDFTEENSRPSQSYLEELSQRHMDMFANIQARHETLQEHLKSQLFWMDLEPKLQETVEKIIFNLDDRGFLNTSLMDIFVPQQQGSTISQEEQKVFRELADEALRIVKTLEPRGVGASNLQECLLLQLDPSDVDYVLMVQLISDHLTDVEHNRLPAISKKMGISLDVLDGLLQKLRRLNPDPGREFRETIVANVVPDVYCVLQDDGRYVVSLDENIFPPLCVNYNYRSMIRGEQVSKEVQDYIRKKMSAAQWLLESIQQRKHTLLRVSQAIMDYQKDFLDCGPDAMRPLKMQQIADELQIQVSTVSRAVDGKWIQTPRGIFPLRRFFVGGYSHSEGDEGISRDTIQLKIKEIIENEDKKNPLSDEAITEELERCGFSINRRTVVKYRQAMNIPSSRQRKVWK